MDATKTVRAGGGAGFRLARGQHVRIIDPEGGQSGDLLAYSPDGREQLSNGRTFDNEGRIYLTTGSVLWSDRCNPMLTIVADEVGRHDFLYAPCSQEMYRMHYGAAEPHANCEDNLRAALRELGVAPAHIPTAFNVFMVAEAGEDGRLSISAPRSKAGGAITLRAEMDLVVALTACPASTCNGGRPPGPIAFQVLEEA